MNALIIGRSGQLARELIRFCPADLNVYAYGRDDIDITSPDSIELVIEKLKPVVIINASAYTAVDKAETEESMAYLINTTAVGYIAKAAKKNRVRLIHVSTDFVFDGEKNTPYHVNDKTHPLNVYGASKLAGELAIKKFHASNSAIVRTSWAYSFVGSNFVKSILKVLHNKLEAKVVTSQRGCPTYVPDLAIFIWKLALRSEINMIYHWSDSGSTSWYEFAQAIANNAKKMGLIKYECEIHELKDADYKTIAKRPSYSLLDTDESQIILQSKSWQSNLNTFFLENASELKLWIENEENINTRY